MVNAMPWPLYPRENYPVPIAMEAGEGPRASLDECGNSRLYKTILIIPYVILSDNISIFFYDARPLCLVFCTGFLICTLCPGNSPTIRERMSFGQ